MHWALNVVSLASFWPPKILLVLAFLTFKRAWEGQRNWKPLLFCAEKLSVLEHVASKCMMVLRHQAETTDLLKLFCEKGSRGNVLTLKGDRWGGRGRRQLSTNFKLSSWAPENGYRLWGVWFCFFALSVFTCQGNAFCGRWNSPSCTPNPTLCLEGHLGCCNMRFIPYTSLGPNHTHSSSLAHSCPPRWKILYFHWLNASSACHRP